MIEPPVVLTIAGSDSGGGAGVQADLRVLNSLGVFGTTAITAVTAQNTVGVQEVFTLAPAIVDAQINSVLSDMRVSAVKTGMLVNADIMREVAKRAALGELPNLVIDPVLTSTSGQPLIDPHAIRGYVDSLIPYAVVVTPNVVEASQLTGMPVASIEQMQHAGQYLHERGARVVVVTGGELGVDVVVGDDVSCTLEAPRVETRNSHGTGCTFASAIAAFIAHGKSPITAIQMAKQFTHGALVGAVYWRIGAGSGPLAVAKIPS